MGEMEDIYIVDELVPRERLNICAYAIWRLKSTIDYAIKDTEAGFRGEPTREYYKNSIKKWLEKAKEACEISDLDEDVILKEIDNYAKNGTVMSLYTVDIAIDNYIRKLAREAISIREKFLEEIKRRSLKNVKKE